MGCVPVAAGTDCGDPGVCDGSGFCAVGTLGDATIYGGDEREEAAAIVALSDGRLFFAGHSVQGAPVPFANGVELPSGATAAFLTGFDAQGLPSWTWRLASDPAGGDRRIRAMAVTDDDNVVVGGSFSAHVSLVTDVFAMNLFVERSTPNDAEQDAFVGAIDADGNGKWLWSSGGPPMVEQTIHDVAVLGDYVVAVGSTGPGTFSFAGKDIGDTSNTADSGFVLVFDAETGDPIDGASWSCLFANATGVATTPDGGIWVVGTYTGAGCIAFDDQFTFMDGGTYPYVARVELDSTGPSPALHVPGGAGVKIESYGGSMKAIVQGPLHVTESGDGVVIAGSFEDQASPSGIDFGNDQILLNGTNLPRPFLVRFGNDGAEWIRGINGTGQIAINDLSSDDVGNVLLAADIELNSVITEDGFIYNSGAVGEDGVVMKFGVTGDLLWGLGSSTPDEDHLESVAVSPTGRLWGVGWGLSLEMWGASPHPDLTDYNVVLFDAAP